mgnify:CR=1 FL=1
MKKGDLEAARIYCNSNYVKYSTGKINQSGEINIQRDLSNVSVEGKIVVQTFLGANTTEAGSEEEKSYIDRIKLTGKAEKNYLEGLHFNK